MLPSVSQAVWEPRRWPIAHLGSLGVAAPCTGAPWGAALADTSSPVVLWQLFASQAQSLLLMTTVAMPVFSKKNETVSEAEAAELCGTLKPKGLLTNIQPFGKAAELWQGGWVIIYLSE